jgi:hypothetical protein
VKKFEYAYFNIYQYYSRQSHTPNCFIVRLKSVYLLSLSAGGWLLLLQSILLRFVRHGWFSSHMAAMFSALTIYTAITLFFYNVFILEERDQKIFDKYIHAWNDNPNKKRDLFVTSFVAVAPYLFMVCIKLILHR